ncbi:MAG: hypothetical protein OXU64_14050 [Gemmatimonadota bacterium]|nr:hypothetical protein [Gemmatimonadota bacterium]
MLRLDILPRLIADSHHDTRQEALEEASRRKASPVAPDAVTRVDESPYGGYRVYTVSLSLAMEVFTDMAESGVFPAPSSGGRSAPYR